jgi:hypothetical protein
MEVRPSWRDFYYLSPTRTVIVDSGRSLACFVGGQPLSQLPAQLHLTYRPIRDCKPGFMSHYRHRQHNLCTDMRAIT